MFITKAEFTSHIYEENINTISGGDETKLDEAIATAMQKAARSLGKYDVAAIFAATDKSKYAELITYIKDIAKYHFIAVCNLSVDYEIAEKRYKAAIDELKSIKNSELITDWPLAPSEVPQAFRNGSNPKIDPYF